MSWKTMAMMFWNKLRNRKMVNCKEVVDLLSDYMANELPEKDVAGIRSHLAGCSNCEAFLTSLKTTVNMTHNLKEEEIPSEVVERLQDFLRSKTRSTG
jgi:predicted anti-sigma-YlaC factor YlaD